MKKRFITIVLDGFGIGAMEDTKEVRPNDKTSNTLGSLLKEFPALKLPTLEKLGLMNSYGRESAAMSFSKEANYGTCNLMHFGADTFMGHQEIMGTLPKKPQAHPFQEKIDEVKKHLEHLEHQVEVIEREELRYLLVDQFATVGDNLEADLGMCYNVTAPLDHMPFEKACEIGEGVRECVTVGRVIVFGGTGNTMDDLWKAEEVRQNTYIGIASAKSKSYVQGYQCRHLGYGVDPKVQTPTILTNDNFSCTLIGKAADIVTNDGGTSISCVPTKIVMEQTIAAVLQMEQGFICANVQETDLAGHSQSASAYRDILLQADKGLGRLADILTEEDILVVMADHGNDPAIGHSGHTRERVPLLVYKKGVTGKNLGNRKSLSDVGATVCDFFGTKKPQNGESFLEILCRPSF